jgi:hypothetical protein
VALLASAGACRPADVEGEALKFEAVGLDDRGWKPTGPAERWVMAASSDQELAALLLQTGEVTAWPEPDPPSAPPLPDGQTALLYYAGYLPGSDYFDTLVGVWDSDGDWVLAVRRASHGRGGTDALIEQRSLLFVDAPPPKSVRLRFEDPTREPPETTWW